MAIQNRISGVILALAFIIAVPAQAAEPERWECRNIGFKANTETVLVAIRNADGKTGQIKVAGVIHEAGFEVTGLSRDWWWGRLNAERFRYRFQIRPDNYGHFFDFSIEPSAEYADVTMSFKCEQVLPPSDAP